MKKTIFTIAMVIAGSFAFAQVSKGTLMFGGSAGVDMTMEKTTKTSNVNTPVADKTAPSNTSWNFTPTVGYFIMDGLSVGLMLDVSSTFMYSVNSQDNSKTENVNQSNLGVGIMARKYMKITDNLYWYGQGALFYVSSGYTNRQSNSTPNGLEDGSKHAITGMGLAISPGITYFVSPKWGIDLGLRNVLGYTNTVNKSENTYISSGVTGTTETSGGSITIGAGLTPTLGLYYYMGK